MTLGNSRRRAARYGRNTIPARRSRRRDRVSPELWEAVWARDGDCFVRRVDPNHACHDGRSVDHVHWIAGGKRSKRAASRLEHLVAMCRGYNVAGPSRIVREKERDYLRDLYPEHGTPLGCLCDEKDDLVPHG